MDLADNPELMKIESEHLIIKPENQSDITKSNGSRTIKFHIPEYVEYFKGDESHLTCDLEMVGRGFPIVDRNAGFFSLIQNLRCYDGTNSHLLDEFLEYSTYLSQYFQYTKTDSNENSRMMYAGFQPNKSVLNNIFWNFANNISWTNGTIVNPPVARKVQISTPLREFKLFSSDSFTPNALMNGGLRLEIQLDDYRRALTFTTGNLGIERTGAVPISSALNFLADGTVLNATTGDFATFTYTTRGSGYIAGAVYKYTINNTGPVAGWVKVVTIQGGGGTGAIGTAQFYCLGNTNGNNILPVQPGQTLNLQDFTPAGGTLATGGVLTLNAGMSPNYRGRTANVNQLVPIPLFGSQSAVAPIAELKAFANSAYTAQTLSPILDNGFIGLDGSLKNPPRVVNPSLPNGGLAGGVIDALNAFPTQNLPFVVGDSIYVCDDDSTHPEAYCGIVCEIVRASLTATLTELPEQMPILMVRPNLNILTATELTEGAVPPAVNATMEYASASLFQYSFTTGFKGGFVFTKESDRLNGVPAGQVTLIGAYPTAVTASALAVDFKMSNLQYQMCRVMMDNSVLEGDRRQAQSEAGLQIDLDSVATRLTNIQVSEGPVSQLISVPNINRAMGAISVPLNQNTQRTLTKSALIGESDNLNSYQYNLGLIGDQPLQQVKTDKANLAYPLLQPQAVNERMKVNDSFGYGTMNLQDTLMNFSVGRAFSRPGMFFSLVNAGDLALKAIYQPSQTFPKLFNHFISHLRSINLSKSGIVVSN